jgi:mRNA interferase MazF
LKWVKAPGNLLLKTRQTGLDKDSVANVSQLTSLDRSELMERVGKIPNSLVVGIHEGLDIVLGR